MARQYFVTGTDTEVGKTFATCALLSAAGAKGLRTLGLKPVAAGGEEIEGQYANEDALALQGAATQPLPYQQINPVLLKAPTSPHIAAHEEGRTVNLSHLEGVLRGALLTPHDLALVEGAGGWRVPLNHRDTLADLAKSLGFPVILVVGLKLGCINHALLTAEAIQRDGLKLAGWVANAISPESMSFENEYLATLKAAISAPLLGYLPFSVEARSQPERLADQLDLSCLDL